MERSKNVEAWSPRTPRKALLPHGLLSRSLSPRDHKVMLDYAPYKRSRKAECVQGLCHALRALLTSFADYSTMRNSLPSSGIRRVQS